MVRDPNGVTEEPAVTTRRGRRQGPRRWRWVPTAGVVGLPALVFVLWWFQPQALLFDNVVDEAFPVDPGADRVVEEGSADDAGPTDPGSEQPDAAVPGPDTEDPNAQDDAGTATGDAAPSEQAESAGRRVRPIPT